MKRFDVFLRNLVNADMPDLQTGSTFDNDILKQAHLMSSTHKVHRNGLPNVVNFLFKPQKVALKIAVVLFFVISGLGINQYMQNENVYLSQDSTNVSSQFNDTIVNYIDVSQDTLHD